MSVRAKKAPDGEELATWSFHCGVVVPMPILSATVRALIYEVPDVAVSVPVFKLPMTVVVENIEVEEA